MYLDLDSVCKPNDVIRLRYGIGRYPKVLSREKSGGMETLTIEAGDGRKVDMDVTGLSPLILKERPDD